MGVNMNSDGLPDFHSPVSILYLAFISTYTILLLVGLGLVWKSRRSSAVRIRGFGITAASVLVIHAYVAAIFIAYPIESRYKCDTEFWYMNFIFPVGLALFQAANARLLAVSQTQHEVYFTNKWVEDKQDLHWNLHSLTTWYKKRDFTSKVYLWIVAGMTMQVAVGLLLFLGSRRFLPAVGFFGADADQDDCQRGLEWIPSIAWQVIWTWLIGPYQLYRTRRIRDTHYWRLQTKLVVFASLPGTPLWAAFLYTEKIQALLRLNYFWPPAAWFAPGLIVMQVTSILIPLYDARKHPDFVHAKPMNESATASLDELSPENVITLLTLNGKDLSGNFPAFLHELDFNVGPLARFAAEREFTAENVEFLCRVASFRRKWKSLDPGSTVNTTTVDNKLQRELFTDAAFIYFELVDPKTSRTPINIDSKTLTPLQRVFHGVAYESSQYAPTSPDLIPAWGLARPNCSSSSTPTPFSELEQDNQSIQHSLHDSSTSALPQFPRGRIISQGLKTATERFYNPIVVPDEFGPCCFDKAEKSIKWLVYTNTWKSFLNEEGAARWNSFDVKVQEV